MKLKVSGKSLIYFQILFGSVIKTVIDLFPAMSILSLVPDFINIAIAYFVFKKGNRIFSNRYVKGIAVFTSLLLLYDIIEAIVFRTDILLFLWAIRNTYRFLLFFFECIALLDLRDIDHIYRLFDRILVINVFAVLLEFLFGYRRDLLGGTFGLTIGCNGPVNIFLVIMSAHSIAKWLNKKISNKKFIFNVGFCLLWAGLAELKFFFIEFVIIVIVEVFRYSNITGRKLKMIIISLISVPAMMFLLLYLFPEQGNILNPKYFIWYFQNVNVGANHFGRYTAFDIVTKVFFDNDIGKIVFGIGAGNGEFSDFAFLNSSFYKAYSSYGYNVYQHSMIYVERGAIGLIWNLLFFLMPIFFTQNKNLKRNSISMEVSAETICYILIIIYNASLRASTSAYFAYFSLSTVYVQLARMKLDGKESLFMKRRNIS